MQDDGFSHATLSVRIVHIDHYLHPLRDYSSSLPFQAARLSTLSSTPPKLPVIRIFGATPAGQSCCLHIHGVRPYLYLELPSTLPHTAAFAYATRLRDALEKALRTAYAEDEKECEAFIAEIEPQLRTDIYGFHDAPKVFLKICTFNPRTVTRIATMVAQGGVGEVVPGRTKVYMAHLPFHMQFLVDCGLAGMAYVNLREVRFRRPLRGGGDAEVWFGKRNAERRFLGGLEKVREDLFWPFHVGKRSSCELEADAFVTHVLGGGEGGGEYKFVSSTLGVLWEEERLRTGKYPPREKVVERKVKAGSALSEEGLREKLSGVLKAEEVEFVGDREEGGGVVTQESQGLGSLDDVMKVLDASGDVDEGDIDEFADDVEDIEDPDIEWDEGVGGEREGVEVVRRDWEDIAECTQHLSTKGGNTQEEDEDALDANVENVERKEAGKDASQHDLTMSDSDSPLEDVDIEVNVNASNHLNPNEKPLETSAQHATNEESPSPALFPPAQKLLSSQSPQASQKPDDSTTVTYTHIRPSERPPAPASLTQTRTPGDAFSITYTTPFYGEKEDETTRREAFGGQIIPVRASGAGGYPPFPVYFDHSTNTVELAPRVIRPAQRPPTLQELKRALVQDKPAVNGTDRLVIDSAGRQVQQRDHMGARDALTLSHNPAVDIVAREDFRRLEGVLDSDDDSESSDDGSGRPLEYQSTATSTEYESLIQNRPLSPKYDEGYQHYVLPTANPARDTPKRKTNLEAKRDGSDASKFDRNSTVSLSESMHRFQNLTVMSIELLAECYSNKLPDPAQNQVLAICATTQKDHADAERQRQNSCILFASAKSPVPHGLRVTILPYESEVHLLDAFAAHIRREDPDVLVGFETQNSSVGYILERAHAISHPFPQMASRWLKGGGFDGNARVGQTSNSAAAAYYHRKGADIKITGRHVLSLWRIVRKEVKLGAYSREAVASELFQMTFPKHTDRDLEDWLLSKRNSARAVRHLMRLASLNVAILDKLNILSRTGELARVFGVDFMSVLMRGSQFRVESMLGRVAKKRDFLLLSAAREEVFQQPAVEALPLVMEPQSALYVDPVIVLDFQSLYPSVIIAHNLCFSTMLGNLNRLSTWSESRRMGVVPNYVPPSATGESAVPPENIFISSCGEMFVDASIRRGILPQLLKEILETRVMVKKAMKSIVGDEATAGLLNARQFGLKMIANVTYGYTAASFSGRMPCAGLADAIVQCGRDCLEEIVRYVEEELRAETGATVVYGDTDSLFVQTPGCTIEEAFEIGERIVAHATKIFPDPITLKLEKVYQPCILQTKKRYVGYSYESKSQAVPIFDAKGIETVRRDSCPLVQKALERAIRILFESKNVSLVKKYVQRLCQKLHLDRIPFPDYIFRKEVRLGSYKEGHLPPAAIVATKAMERDPRAVPRHGERVPFVVLYDKPGAPLKDCVVSPEDYLVAARHGLARLNTTYYIIKQILPAMNRIFSLIGVRVSGWYAEVPRPLFDPIIPVREREKRIRDGQSSLHMFYTTEKCAICHGKGVERQICAACVEDMVSIQAARFLIAERARGQEENRAHLMSQCFRCVTDRAEGSDDVRCCNLLCSVNDELSVANRKIMGLRQILDDSTIWKID